MKVKIKFSNVKSSSDTLKLKAYGDSDEYAFKILNKADYENGWDGLSNKTVEISPYVVGDLSKFYIEGLEKHIFNVSEEKLNQWKEYCSDKADISTFFYRYKELNPEKIIKISNINNINDSRTLKRLVE